MSGTTNAHVRSGSTSTTTRRVLVMVAGLSALLLSWLGPVSAAVADDPLPTPTARDRLTVSGYDLASDVPAAVVAGSSGNNLRVDFTAGDPLVDGTFVVTLPSRQWPTDLHPAGGLRERDPDLPGSFVVRPVAPDFPPRAGDCRGTGDAPITVTVLNAPRRHVGVVQHVSCDRGQSISVRIAGVDAPRSVGRHPIGVTVSDASGRREHRSLGVRVVKPPVDRLVVEVPDDVTIYEPTPVVVRAVRPDGRVDTHARGWVRLTGPGHNQCIFVGGAPVGFELTAADAGTKVVDVHLQVLGSEQIVAESSSNRAQTGISNPFVVSGEQHGAYCSVSYH